MSPDGKDCQVDRVRMTDGSAEPTLLAVIRSIDAESTRSLVPAWNVLIQRPPADPDPFVGCWFFPLRPIDPLGLQSKHFPFGSRSSVNRINHVRSKNTYVAHSSFELSAKCTSIHVISGFRIDWTVGWWTTVREFAWVMRLSAHLPPRSSRMQKTFDRALSGLPTDEI